jgi:hypothetical protein
MCMCIYSICVNKIDIKLKSNALYTFTSNHFLLHVYVYICFAVTNRSTKTAITPKFLLWIQGGKKRTRFFCFRLISLLDIWNKKNTRLRMILNHTAKSIRLSWLLTFISKFMKVHIYCYGPYDTQNI